MGEEEEGPDAAGGVNTEGDLERSYVGIAVNLEEKIQFALGGRGNPFGLWMRGGALGREANLVTWDARRKFRRRG